MQTTLIPLIIFHAMQHLNIHQFNTNFHKLMKQSYWGLNSLTQGYNAKPTSLQ